jgi:hypothetical protein
MEASDTSNVVVKKNPVIQFSRHIFKSVVSNEKAQNAFNSISMASIPANKEKSLSLEGKSYSSTERF